MPYALFIIPLIIPFTGSHCIAPEEGTVGLGCYEWAALAGSAGYYLELGGGGVAPRTQRPIIIRIIITRLLVLLLGPHHP